MAAGRLVVLAAAAATVTGQQLSLSVSSTGSFSIGLDGTEWLAGDDYAIGSASTAGGTLKMTGPSKTSDGTDALGSYSATTLTWASTSSSTTVMETTFKTYHDDAGMVVFEQTFPNAITEAPEVVGDARDSFYSCRVASKPSQLTSSEQGYTAYTMADGKATPHSGKYCDDGHAWSYTSDTANLTECEAVCVKAECACFDYKAKGSGGNGGGTGSGARTLFPGFKRNTGPSDDKPAFAYHGVFPKMSTTTVAKYSQSHQGGVPLVIYDPATLKMVVFSPLNYPKAHHMTSSDSFFGAGVKDTVTEIPAGWTQSFILSSGSGITDGMMAWGDRMLKFTGKPRADKYRDTTHSTIGFWTDNGGYYHYSTGLPSEGSTYEEVLPKVKAYHDSIGVPFGHWQFDSWFYPKDGGVNAGGGGGAVTNWTAMDSVFPDGMADINKKLGGMPTVMHNRQWSDKSDYIKHWLDIPWYEDKYAIPEDPVKFFTRFFTQQQGWGLTMYEQDWMCTEYDGVAHLQTNITLGDAWLYGMATGAASSNRTVQYCMPYPNDLLSASAYSAVTNARATGDYFHASNQWAVGHTSLFYWAIGVLPFKDGFYSSNNKQVGGQTVGPETNPDRETIMATLSTAMVGPMDGIFLLNKSRVMATCRADGTVLKPDRPVHVSDVCFASGASGDPASCYIYTTHSAIPGLGQVNYVFLNDATDVITPATVHVNSSSNYAVFNFYTKEVAALKATNTLTSGYENHVYATVTPVVNGWAFVGEADKYVTAASIRFASVSATGSGLTAQVVGVPKDNVTVCAAAVSDYKLVCKEVAFSSSTTTAVSFP